MMETSLYTGGLTRPLARYVAAPTFTLDITEESITLGLGRLRPEKPVEATEFHLFLHERPDEEQVDINWTLNSTTTEGIQRGTISLPVSPTQGIYLEPDPNPPSPD